MIALLALATAVATDPQPRAVERYGDCVKTGVINPANDPAGFDDALDKAKAACASLNGPALDAVRKKRGQAIASKGGEPEAGAKAMLDALVDELAAKAWAGQHPEDLDGH